MTDEAMRPAGMPAGPEARGIGAQVKGAADDVGREARGAVSAVRDEASGLATSIKQGLSSQVERQKNGVADRLSVVADRVRRTADDLREDEAWLGGLVGRGAEELAGLAGDLRHNDVSDLVGSVEVFAQRQPALFVGAAVALGFALTRVVGAGDREADARSTRHRYAPHAGSGSVSAGSEI